MGGAERSDKPIRVSTRPSFQDALRRTIDGSGISRYRICKETGIDQSQFSRFMAGKSNLSLESLDRVLRFIGAPLLARVFEVFSGHAVRVETKSAHGRPRRGTVADAMSAGTLRPSRFRKGRRSASGGE